MMDGQELEIPPRVTPRYAQPELKKPAKEEIPEFYRIAQEQGLSEPETERHVSAFKKYGIPLGLAAIAFGIASRDGQGPEAAVASLSGYIKGAQAAAREAHERKEKKRTEKLNLLGQLYPNLTPESQARAAGMMGGLAGTPLTGLQVADPRAESNRRIAQQVEMQRRQFQEQLGLASLKDPRSALQGAEMLENLYPSMGKYARAIADAQLAEEKDRTAGQKVLLEAYGKIRSGADFASMVQKFEGVKDPRQQELMLQAILGEAQETRRMVHERELAGLRASTGGYQSNAKIIASIAADLRMKRRVSPERMAYWQNAPEVRANAGRAWDMVNSTMREVGRVFAEGMGRPTSVDVNPAIWPVVKDLRDSVDVGTIRRDLFDKFMAEMVETSGLADVYGAAPGGGGAPMDTTRGVQAVPNPQDGFTDPGQNVPDRSNLDDLDLLNPRKW
jgi:hypothetical protein